MFNKNVNNQDLHHLIFGIIKNYYIKAMVTQSYWFSYKKKVYTVHLSKQYNHQLSRRYLSKMQYYYRTEKIKDWYCHWVECRTKQNNGTWWFNCQICSQIQKSYYFLPHGWCLARTGGQDTKKNNYQFKNL